ncbi:MAG TPA: efflux RND transporter permease subunit [Gammaproteobacteria bacterium]|nr:efflux RND transporter permease subunit [Gammaproteobacteria bacterium]
MNWTSYFIKKPILSLSLCIFILFFGGMAFYQLPFRLVPKITMPIIDVETEYAGASAETIQSTLTNVLQNTFFDLQGIDYIQSSSSFGKSDIQIHFKLGCNDQLLLNNVMNKIHSVKQLLPKESGDSIVKKLSGDDKPAFIIAFMGRSLSNLEINDYIKRMIKPRIELIPDIAEVEVMGESPAMRIWLDPHRLDENFLTPMDVAESLKNQNITSSIGIQKTGSTQFLLDANSALLSEQQFNQIIVKSLGDNVLRLKDIGHASLGPDGNNITTIVNGTPATMVFVKLLPEANPFAVSKKMNASLSEIEKILPKNIRASVVYDTSRYIKLALSDLTKTIFMTFFIIIAVVLLFLGSLRAALIPIVAIPLSIIGMGWILWLGNASINTLTLLAMVIAIGLVVDDAIVVLENIYRYLEKGMGSNTAALRGIEEMIIPVISMSILLSVAYLPIIFIGGLTGKIFSEFALALAASVLISCIVSIILTPMMCSKLLFYHNNHFNEKLMKIFNWMKERYQVILMRVLSFRDGHLLVGLFFIILLLSGLLYCSLPKELASREDQGFLQILGKAPASTTDAYLKKYTNQLNSIYQKNSEIDRYIYINNVPEEHQFLSFITLKPENQRKHSARELRLTIQQQLDEITGINGTVIEPPALPVSGSMPIEFILKSEMDYGKLYQLSDNLKLQAMKSGKFLFLEQDVHFEKPQYNLNIDRNIAANFGININDITNNLNLMLGDTKIQQFTMRGENYPVILHITNEADAINKIYLRNQSGNIVPLISLIDIKKSIKADYLNQFQKMQSITLSGVMRPGLSVSDGLNTLQNALKKLSDNNHVLIDYSGESRELIKEVNQGWILFLAAFVLIYLLLAILFESFILPIIVLFSCLPGAFFSVLFSLYFTNSSINLYTEIGMLTLMGLISKHGILIIQFAEKIRQDKNISHREAILESAALRLRPIMMTTAAMFFSGLPLIFSSGVGSKSHFDLGIVIVSGISIGTLFALILVPFFYCLFFTLRSKKSDEENPCYI